MIRRASVVKSRINMMIYGGFGAGKSTFALNAAYLNREDGKPFRIFYIDTENGGIDDYLTKLQSNGVDIGNILVATTSSQREIQDFIDKVKNKEDIVLDDGEVALDADGEKFVADMIILDSASVVHDTSVEARRKYSKKRAMARADKKADISNLERMVMIDGADIELKDYSTINFDESALALDLAATGLHYIVTVREKEVVDKKIIKVNGVDKEVSVNTGKYEPDGFKKGAFNVKTVARIWRDETDGVVKMICSKDRTGTYEENVIIEDPSVLEFQKMIEKNKEKKNYVPVNGIRKDVEKEVGNFERELLSYDSTEPQETKKTSDGSDETNIIAVKTEYKNIFDSLTPVQKETLKQKLIENNIKGIGTKNSDSEEMTKRLEIIKSIQ